MRAAAAMQVETSRASLSMMIPRDQTVSSWCTARSPPDCIQSAGYRYRTPVLPAVKARKPAFGRLLRDLPRTRDGALPTAQCLLLSMRPRRARFLPLWTHITYCDAAITLGRYLA